MFKFLFKVHWTGGGVEVVESPPFDSLTTRELNRYAGMVIEALKLDTIKVGYDVVCVKDQRYAAKAKVYKYILTKTISLLTFKAK